MDNEKRTVVRHDTKTSGPAVYEPEATAEYSPEGSSLSWRSIFAGLFVALLTYSALMALGLAVGAGSIQGAIGAEGVDTQAFSIGSGVWIVISVLVSLFVGSYYCARVSGIVPKRVGAVGGAVITSLFFLFMASGLSFTAGAVGRGMSSIVGAAGSAAGDLAQNPTVQSTVEDALGGLNLKSSPETVVKGVATRLLRGDEEGANRYLANQAGISPDEARGRITELSTQVKTTAADVANKTAKAVSIAAWTLFGALVLGTAAAAFGGALGIRNNFETLRVGDRSRDRVRAA